MFSINGGFATVSLIIVGVLVALYTVFWYKIIKKIIFKKIKTKTFKIIIIFI
jgi:hypothetical protein